MSAAPSPERDTVLAALEALHAADTNEQTRRQANDYLEHFKQTAQQHLPTIYTLISQSQNDIARHYALLCMEQLIVKQWKSLGDNDRQVLQQQSLEFLQNLCVLQQQQQQTPVSTFVKQKFISVIHEVILRTYPQQWPTLLDDLHQLAVVGEVYGMQLAVLVYQSLADSIVNYHPNLQEARRREIQQALLADQKRVFTELHQILQHALQLYTSAPSQQRSVVESTILTSLQALTTFSEFFPAGYLFESQLIKLLVAQLNQITLYIPLIELLQAIVHRKLHTIEHAHHQQLLYVYHTICNSVDSLLSMPEQMLADDDKSLYLRKTMAVLDDLLKYHHTVLQPAHADQLKYQLLTVLTRTFSSTTVEVSITTYACELLVFIFKSTGNTILIDSIRSPLITELCHVIAHKLVKPPKPNKLREQTAEDEEWNDATEDIELKFRLQSQLRTAQLQLVQQMSEVEVLIVLQVTLDEYLASHQRFTAQNSVVDFPNKHSGYVTTDSTIYREREALATLLDFAQRSIPATKQWHQTDARVTHLQQHLLDHVLNAQRTDDPLLVAERLQNLSLFVNLYNDKPQLLLNTVLSELTSSIIYQSPAEKQRQSTWFELSEDTKSARRRAIATLIIIGRKCSQHLLPVFEQLVNTVLQWVQTKQIVQTEANLLYEFLVTTIINSTSQQSAINPQHTKFLQQLLEPAVQYWSSDAAQQHFQTVDATLALLGADDISNATTLLQKNTDLKEIQHMIHTTTSKQHRSQLLNTINTFISILRPIFAYRSVLQSTAKQGSNGLPAASFALAGAPPTTHATALSSLTPQLLPTTLAVLQFTLSLHSPTMRQHLPLSLTLLNDAGSNEQLQLLLGGSDSAVSNTYTEDENWLLNGQLSSADNVQHAILTDLQRWLDRTMDGVASLLAMLVRGGDAQFYERALSSERVKSSLTQHISHASHWQLRMTHDKVINALLAGVPAEYYSSLLIPVMTDVWTAVRERYSKDWQQRTQQQQAATSKATTSLKTDIYLDTQLRESTRSCIDAVYQQIVEWDKFHVLKAQQEMKAAKATASQTPQVQRIDASQKEKFQVSELTLLHHPLFIALFHPAQPQAQQSLLALLATLIDVPDTTVQQRTITIVNRLLPFLTQSLTSADTQQHAQQLVQLFVPVLYGVLQALSKQVPDEQQQLEQEFVLFIKDLYTVTAKHQNAAVHTVLRSIPGLTAGELDAFYQLVTATDPPAAEKRQKAALKSLLRQHVMGKQAAFVLDHSKANGHIDSLTSIGTKPNGHHATSDKPSKAPELDPTSLATLFT